MVLESIELDLLMYVKYDFAKKFNVLPVRRYDNGIIIICSEINEKVVSDLKEIFNENIVSYIHSKSVVEENIEYYYELLKERQAPSENYSEDIYDEVFKFSINLGVRDIHMEPQSDGVNIRIRCEGELKNFKKISFSAYKYITTKIKFLSNIDLNNNRVFQEGNILYNFNNEKYIINVSIFKVSKGEKIFLKINYKSNKYKNIQSLGFDDKNFKLIKKFLNNKNGMILVSGAVGSGKSTTIYKFIEHLNKEEVNIYTLEDQLEYEIDGINQSVVDEKQGSTFEELCGSILKQNPDIIMVDEINSEKNAKFAVSSSVVGHKVFSTIHAKDSLSVISRLKDLGVNESLIIDSLDMIISQKLIKKLCKCKRKEFFDEQIILNTKYEKGKYYSPKGCEKCKFTGYSGRILLSEILVIDDIIKDMLFEKKSDKEIKKYINDTYYEYSFANNLKKLINNGDVYIKDAI